MKKTNGYLARIMMLAAMAEQMRNVGNMDIAPKYSSAGSEVRYYGNPIYFPRKRTWGRQRREAQKRRCSR